MKTLNKYSLLILVLSFVSPEMSGQNSTYYDYNELIQKASEFAELNLYSEAVRSYDEAFDKIKFVPYHYYDAFEAAVNDSNYSKASH